MGLIKIKIGRGMVVAFMSVPLFFLSPNATRGDEKEFSRQREIMVREQIEARGVTDRRTLEAMLKVKRHLFVPQAYRNQAYADRPLPIGEGQTISQPYIVGLMTQLLALEGNERILEIGTGSGYQAAILAEMSREVYTIEILEPLTRQADKLLKELGYSNIYIRRGNGFLGWPDKAPFEAIIVTCAPAEIPPALIEQLAEGGRLVIPVGRHWQELKLVKKIEGRIITENIIPVRFVPMIKGKKSETEDNPQSKEISGNLKRHTAVLSGDIGERNFILHQNLERAADYISEEFKNYGYEPQEQVYQLENKPFRNIIAVKKGKVYTDKVVIICAHYDSVVGSPGADDNASGVAGLLELSRLLVQEDLNQTIKFIAFTNEEPPFYTTQDMGSIYYAQEAKKRGENIEAVFCLESIGYYSDKRKSQSYPFGLSLFYPDRANFIAIAGNTASHNLLKKTVKEFRKHSDFPLEYLVAPVFLAPAIGFSDHASFWKFGYPAIMITDTAFYRSPYYHTAQDTSEGLNYGYMASVIKGLYKVIRGF